MIEGRPFLYQAQNGIVYRVDAKGVQVIGLPPNEHIVAFVDGDKDDHEPDHLLLNNKVRIILTSPPKGSRARWINQAAGHVKVIATKLWSEHELFIAGFVLGLLLSMLDLSIFLGYSFIPLISLSTFSGSQHRALATTHVNASILPSP